jgi:septal ring factor EnvC (AmiA/AmiB activator)
MGSFVKAVTESKLLLSSLKAENQRLHRRIASLDAKLISSQGRITALEKEIKSGNNRELAKILDEISQNEKAAGQRHT